MITSEEINKSKFERMLNRHKVNKVYRYQNGATVSTFRDTRSMTMIAVPCHPRVIMTGRHARNAFILAKNFTAHDQNQSKLEDF